MATEKDQVKTPLRPCRSLPGYVKKNRETELDSRIFDGVECMLLFIGYARSGHTLIGSLLDAHPNIVVANEYNVLGKWVNFSAEDRNKNYLYHQLYLNSYSEARKGVRSSADCYPKTKYNYLVPNQWQGTFNQSIKIIGDKKGGKTSGLLEKFPQFWTVLQEIKKTVKVPVKFIHVVRNPFDNIATMLLRQILPGKVDRQLLYKNPINFSKLLQTRRAEYYLRIARKNNRLIKIFNKNVITIQSEAVIENPREQLLKICDFFNVWCSEDYVKDCSSIIHSNVSKSRNTMNWDDDAKNIILKNIKEIPFLQHYTFHE